ncbi:4457_t:CDS:2, partial [Gigaspora rosea]
MEPTVNTNLPFRYYSLYPLFKESLMNKTYLYDLEGNDDNEEKYSPFRRGYINEAHLYSSGNDNVFSENSLSTNILIDEALNCYEDNNISDDLDHEPQQFFDLENGNVANSLIGNVNNSHEENEIVTDS